VSDSAELRPVLERFATLCEGNERLRAMNRDWRRTVVVRPDGGEPVWLRYDAGRVWLLQEPAVEADLEVEGPPAVLLDVFSGRTAPTEPYMAGDLRVHGSQDDMMRLDIITLLIWGE
jgi:putative sterol carrier protein